MRDALAYEWVRIRTVRSTWLLTAFSLVVTVLAAWGLTASAGSTGPGGELPPGAEAAPTLGDQAAYAAVLTAGAQLTPVLMGLLGAFAFGHEYRFGTIRPALTALPRRTSFAAAKVLVITLWAAGVGVACVALSALFLALFGGGRFQPGVGLTGGPTERVALGVVLYVVLVALVGLALGWLFRNVPAAVTLLLVIPFIAEPLIRAILSIEALEPVAGIGRFLPFTAGQQLFAYSTTTFDPEIPEIFRNDLTPLTGGLTLAAVTAVLLALAHALFLSRDA